jgi:hypothetical protein
MSSWLLRADARPYCEAPRRQDSMMEEAEAGVTRRRRHRHAGVTRRHRHRLGGGQCIRAEGGRRPWWSQVKGGWRVKKGRRGFF